MSIKLLKREKLVCSIPPIAFLEHKNTEKIYLVPNFKNEEKFLQKKKTVFYSDYQQVRAYTEFFLQQDLFSHQINYVSKQA